MRPMAGLRAAAIAALALALTLAAVPAGAKDLGVRGATWPVAEPDLLTQIETRLLELERSGELARLQMEARSRARSQLEEPEAVSGIAPALKQRSRLFDPSIAVERDIRTADGTPIALAGARVNPLATHPLTRDLLFIDGRREAEVAWALDRKRPAKIVLLAGRPLDLARRFGAPVFFDQGGRLAARFGLTRTPVLVEQAGAKLRITEVPLRDDGRVAGGAGKATGKLP